MRAARARARSVEDVLPSALDLRQVTQAKLLRRDFGMRERAMLGG